MLLLSLPVIAVPAAGAPAQTYIVEFRAGAASCGGQAVATVSVAQPLPVGAFFGTAVPAGSATMTFAIDRAGRPVDIADPTSTMTPRWMVSTEDLAPALAASRFEPAARSDCSITYRIDAVPVASATRDTLFRFVALPAVGSAGRTEAIKRATTEQAGNCFSPALPDALLRGMPDFDRIPQPPGTFSWTAVGFEIAANGRTRGTATLASDGNAALDRAGRDAVQRSQFVAGRARNGCNLTFYRNSTTPISAPPAPDRSAFVPAGATCDPLASFASQPQLVFPNAFRRRAVEGWALVRYDVAPWGVTGNVAVLAAAPARAFGETARTIIARSKRAPSTAGAVGCVTYVRFEMPAKQGAVDTTMARSAD